MKLSIYARLVISYFVFFAMLAGVSLFFMYNLNRFNQVMQSIILNDTAVMEYSVQLSDDLLAEVRNERKYLLLNDETLYRNYQEARDEFENLLQKTELQETDPAITAALRKISRQHQEFTRLVEEERKLRENSSTYSAEKYETEKKDISNAIITTLNEIQDTSEKNIFGKIRKLGEAGERAGSIAITITAAALFTALLVAAVITRSITRPLRIIKAKTREIALGNFQSDLRIESPPAIKELAIAINTMCRKLQELDNMKSAFFAHMSHELRTPLASIKEGTNILLDRLGGDLNEKQQRILTIIAQESERLINLINSLLDLAKMEAGMMVYNFMKIDLPTLVRETLQGLQPLAEARSLEIVNKIADLPPVKVDQDRVMQVLRNLVGNAIKFTPAGGVITLSARLRGKMVEVGVHDTGIGIPQEDLERIFLRFQQVLPTGSDRIKGTGLGLATVKQIILAHGGKAWATSQMEKGSTFYFTLPLGE